jgi:hypothetical protein
MEAFSQKMLAEMANVHSSDAYYAADDPLLETVPLGI